MNINNNVQHDFSYYATDDFVKKFLEGNLLLANVRNAGVEIDDDELERLSFEGAFEAPENYDTEYLQEKLGRFLTPTELEVLDVVMNKLLANDNLLYHELKTNEYGRKYYDKQVLQYIEKVRELQQNTLDMLYTIFSSAQQIRFKK